MKTNQTTIHIAGDLYATTAAKYGPQYREHTARHTTNVIKLLQYLHTRLNTSGKEKIVFKPIRGRVNGCYLLGQQTIFLDPRYSTRNVTVALTHELIHAEQYHTGKLGAYSKNYVMWHGKPFDIRNFGSMGYYASPWEQEAYSRQNDLADEALIACGIN